MNYSGVIIHIDNLDKYLTAQCYLRPKKSGSRSVSKVNKQIFYRSITEEHPHIEGVDLFYGDKDL